MTVVKRSCGHETNISLDGLKPFERDGKLVWAARSKCPSCDPKMKKRDRERRQAALDSAQDREARMGLSPLRGSAKQVAWATSVRVDLLEAAFDVLELAEDVFSVQVVAVASQVDAARWWIDNRELAPEGLVDALAAALGTEVSATENPF
ncbi:hypothetical protein ACTVBU_10940 [Sanguibacter sp. A246]|uniref:hypothetical protein n=1 Tax=Sanguibacter sp. A246 TaxID=3457326 RepID=UPI003FD7CF70